MSCHHQQLPSVTAVPSMCKGKHGLTDRNRVAGEMAQWLDTPATPAEDLALVPATTGKACFLSADVGGKDLFITLVRISFVN